MKVKYYLPFRMLVIVGEYYCGINEEIRTWLDSNFDNTWEFAFHHGYCLYFENDKDMTLFILRWGS